MPARAQEIMDKTEDAVKAWLTAKLAGVIPEVAMLCGFQDDSASLPYLAIVADSAVEDPPESGCHTVHMILALHSHGQDTTRAQHRARAGYIESQLYSETVTADIVAANASLSEWGLSQWNRGRVERSVDGPDLVTTWEAEAMAYASD